MKQIPDIIGLPLEVALRELKEAGWAVDLEFTRPGQAEPGGEPRAVRFKMATDHKLVLTVVCEAKGGRNGGR